MIGPRAAVLGLILLSVSLNASAQLFLRAAMKAGLPTSLPPIAMAMNIGLRPGIIGGLACYGLSLLLWIYVLSKTDASFAYPFLGIGFAIVAVASYFLLGEPMSARKIVGTMIIAAGIAVLASS